MAARRDPASRVRSTRRRQPSWTLLDDEALLERPLSSVALPVAGSWIEPHVERLHRELDAKGIRLKPHVWFATEWFSPDGVPGIAIPFYLSHPRLMRLERRMMLDVEGGTPRTALAILRHEAGHAVDTAYRLRRKPAWRKAFGRAGRPYRAEYAPDPSSRAFVQHLGGWYAQSHPVEDFAETFAVWLAPRSAWRRRYAGWKALAKLEAMEGLMAEIAGRRPAVATREVVDPISKREETLRRHYARRRATYGVDRPAVHDEHLVRVFGRSRNGETAASYLRREAPQLRRRVSAWTGAPAYTVEQILFDMERRCRRLDLRVSRATGKVRLEAAILLTVGVMALGGGRRPRVVR